MVHTITVRNLYNNLFIPGDSNDFNSLINMATHDFVIKIEELGDKRNMVYSVAPFPRNQYEILIGGQDVLLDPNKIKEDDYYFRIKFNAYEKVLHIYMAKLPKNIDLHILRDLFDEYLKLFGVKYIVCYDDQSIEKIYKLSQLSYIEPELLNSIDINMLGFRHIGSYFEINYKNKPFFFSFPEFKNKEMVNIINQLFDKLGSGQNLHNIHEYQLQKVSPLPERILHINLNISWLRHYYIKDNDKHTLDEIHNFALKGMTEFFKELNEIY